MSDTNHLKLLIWYKGFFVALGNSYLKGGLLKKSPWASFSIIINPKKHHFYDWMNANTLCLFDNTPDKSFHIFLDLVLVKAKQKGYFHTMIKSLLSLAGGGLLCFGFIIFLLSFFFFFMRGCVWPRSGLSLGPQPDALSLLYHLISLALHKGELVTWAQFGPL